MRKKMEIHSESSNFPKAEEAAKFEGNLRWG